MKGNRHTEPQRGVSERNRRCAAALSAEMGFLSRSITRRSGQNCKIILLFYILQFCRQLVKKVQTDFFDKLRRCIAAPFLDSGLKFVGIDDGVVVKDPFLHIDDIICRLGPADDDLGQAGVDDHAAAHGAWLQARQQFAAGNLPRDDIHRTADALAARGGDDRVRLGVNAAAELVPLAGGDIQTVTDTVAQLGAVAAAAGRAVVACGDDLVVADDQCAVGSAQAGGSLQNRFCYIELVVFLINAAHLIQASSLER